MEGHSLPGRSPQAQTVAAPISIPIADRGLALHRARAGCAMGLLKDYQIRRTFPVAQNFPLTLSLMFMARYGVTPKLACTLTKVCFFSSLTWSRFDGIRLHDRDRRSRVADRLAVVRLVRGTFLRTVESRSRP